MSETLSPQGRATLPALWAALLGWYRREKRTLPWRATQDPYAIWVSEIMLQQTRVDTVVPYYERFLARFPTAAALAEAPLDDVLAAWSGLGYYRRARLLHAGARAVAERGAMPDTRAGLRSVPGIGPYTAGAVASIAFREAVGLVDGNVARVLSRLFLIEDDMRGPGLRKAQALADAIVAVDAPGDWNQALMELGATVCTPTSPRCHACPAADACAARGAGRARELPVLAPKKKPLAESARALVARTSKRPERVLVGRRAGDRRFGGLWEPPFVADGGAFPRSLVRGTPKVVGDVVHVLSHRRLAVEVVTARLARVPGRTETLPGYDALALVTPAELVKLAVSKLARKVLAAAGVELPARDAAGR